VAIGIFAVLGPPIGVFLSAVYTNERFPPFHPGTLFILVGSYLVAGSAALVAGLVYSILSAGLVLAFKLERIGVAVATSLGAASGAIGMGVKNLSVSGSLLPASMGMTEFFAIAIAAGVVSALLCAFLFPIGVNTEVEG